jgi:hypothetical protein
MSMQKHADTARASASTADFKELAITGLACAKKPQQSKVRVKDKHQTPARDKEDK